jgi:hypothetical protein
MLFASVHAAKWPLHISTKTFRVLAVIHLVACRARQTMCALRGHDMVLHFEPRRLSMCCLCCGVRTQGWTIDVNPDHRTRPRSSRHA